MAPARRSSYPPVLSIDFLARQSRQLPFIALSFSLSRLALGFKWSNLDNGLIAFFAVSLVFYLLHIIDGRIAWGSARKLHWDDEVVVITGGSSGLGKVIADTYAMRGVSVAVLDVRPFYERDGDEEDGSVKFYKVDVGDEMAIQQVKTQIEKDLGTPTILINNAGIVNGKTLLEVDSAALEKNFRVNLLSHFHTIRAFLPAMMRRKAGTIVTVASVLGDLGASQLSDYTAAKAGLIAMHTSLRSELADAGQSLIKTVLVKPGQLSTPLFKGIETPNSFLGPVVDPLDLAQGIIMKVDSGQSGVIAMPFYADRIEWLSVLPYGMQRIMRWASGVDRAMRTFKGS
ncbi:short-chain dehydrogenase-like protein 10 [Elsinoe australis]|uniref:Short-chain dehydrogenase/reductase 3 n=1 Tax=Elsinoe australis TaxID=40998 RepID=A0A4U7ASI8_9PEZI|nr:short-chain dehydrogenase-like protein 10 [Elsinoe australis]